MTGREQYIGETSMTGKVSFIGAGPGDPELITLKGWRALQRADVILHDSLIDPRIMEETPAEKIYVGKRCGKHSMSQEEINRLIGDLALQGKHVARLKGGDPSVLGRVGEEILHLAAQGIPYEIIPGVTSAVSVPVFAGIPVTHRGLADGFVVVTAHRRFDHAEFSIPAYNERCTVVLLMSLGTTGEWRKQLLGLGYPPDLPVAFISAGGTERQQVLVTNVQDAAKDAAASTLVSPTLAVVGRVVTLRERMQWFEQPSAKEEVKQEIGQEIEQSTSQGDKAGDIPAANQS